MLHRDSGDRSVQRRGGGVQFVSRGLRSNLERPSEMCQKPVEMGWERRMSRIEHKSPVYQLYFVEKPLELIKA
jgi:hypothetical protein